MYGLTACAPAAPTATPGHSLLYANNFENEAALAGWHVGGPGMDYLWLENTKAGKYRFEYPTGFLESQDFNFADVQIAVDVEFLVKTRTEVGVACRMQPNASGRYYFSIANDGRWNISKSNNGETLLAQGQSDVIRPDKNRLAARCVGDQLTLLVNAVELGSARDGELTSGSLNFGYVAESAGAGTFDNIMVEDWGTGQTSTPQPQAQPGEILYAENFDQPDALSGWDAKLDDKSQANPQDGAYRLSVDAGMVALIQRQQSFTDAVIEVDIQFRGPDPARAGVLCRNETGNYNFTLSSAGEWTIESSGKTLANGQAAIQSGVNRLLVSCVGNQMGFTLNGATLGKAQDDSFRQGQIGFTLDSSGRAEVLFDNLTVRLPATQATEATPTLAPTREPATSTPSPTSTATPTLPPTPATTLRPTVIPADELSLYQTEFDEGDPTLADWKTFAYSMDEKAFVTQGFETFTSNGFYRFRQEANTRVFAIYNRDLGTADVDLSTRGNAPFEGNGGLGLVCRYSEAGWYQFMVEPYGGRWSIRLAKPDENGQFHFHVISAASAPKWLSQNVDLRAECKGDRLTFYIDGEKMASVHDSAFPTGKVGLLGWSFTLPGDGNMVDLFSVRRAQWNETGLTGPAPTPGADGAIYSTDFGKLDDLNPYWTKVDLGVQNIPGSPVLVGGPGHAAPHTYQYINDFDPGADVEIAADVQGAWIWPRGMICRYSEDGWYETFYMKDDQSHARVALVLGQRDEQGRLTRSIMDTYYPPTADARVNLTLTCVGNQISVKLNGEVVLHAEDNTWRSGRYGLFFTDTPPGNLRGTLLSYTVRSAQPILTGTLLNEKVFASPEEIAANWGLDLQGNPMVKIEEGALFLDADNGIGLSGNTGVLENSEMSLDVEFLDDGTLYLQCRSESSGHAVFEVRNNGEWLFYWRDQEVSRGSSSAIQSGKNALTMRCESERLTLLANGETVTQETYPSEYTPIQGRISVWVNARLRVNNIALKVYQGSPNLTAPIMLNQASLPPSYQPGDTIFDWDHHSLLAGCNNGWWGRDPNPCLWRRNQRQEDWERSLQGDQVLVKGYDQSLTLFTYQPDLYDLPIEINADATLTGKSGGVALFCRATGAGRYEFYLQPDGAWYIRRNVIYEYGLPEARHLTILAHGTVENFTPENALMSATCSDSDLIFTLNGAELGRVQDTLYPEGQAGILFDVFSEGSFTNLTIARAK